MSERVTHVDENYDGESPSGSRRDGYSIYHQVDDYLQAAIRALIRSIEKDRWLYLDGGPTVTVHNCWSGYSEYTITSRWDEIGIEWDGHSLFFDDMSKFFRAVADVDEDYWDA